MARVGRENELERSLAGSLWKAGTWSAEMQAICLFLAGLLDTLLAGVEGSLLALGLFDHVLLGLGI
jgi:hypothetical protein